MSFEIKAHADRTQDFTLSLFESGGTTALVLAATDVVRVKVGQAGAVPILDLDSVGATANGSVVTIDTLDPASTTLRLAEGDLETLSGTYDIEVDVVDDSETIPVDAIKSAGVGILHIIASQAGETMSDLDNHIADFNAHVVEFDDHVSIFNSHTASFDDHVTAFDSHVTVFNNHVTDFDNHIVVFDAHVTDFGNHVVVFDTHVANQTAAFVNVLDGDATGNGYTDDRVAIEASMAIAEDSGAALLFPSSSGNYKIAGDLTFTVPCIFMGGVLAPDSSIIVMFNKPVDNPLNVQCFKVTYERGLAAASTVGDDTEALPGIRFSRSSGQPLVRPQWWGAIGDNSTDSADAIQQAIDAVSFDGINNYTAIPVKIPCGRYAVSREPFVGYDFINYDNTDTYLCRPDYENTPSRRRSPVPLITEGGAVYIRYTGAAHTDQSSKYLLYYAGGVDQAPGIRLSEIILDCNFERRGFFISGLGYSKSIADLTVMRSREVAFDIFECYTVDVKQLHCLFTRGIGVRIFSSSGSNIGPFQYGNLGEVNGFADVWPKTDETHMVTSYGAVLQTSVDERAAYVFTASKLVANTLNIESAMLAWPTYVYYGSKVDSKLRCHLADHEFQEGNKFYFVEGGATDHDQSAGTVYDVIEDTDNYFFLDYNPGGAENQNFPGYLYRVCESITQDATLGVAAIKNHRFAEGNRIKFNTSTGMAELDDNWYRVGPPTYLSGTATGGSSTKLIDTTQDFSTIGVGGRVYNTTDNSVGVITAVSQTTNPNDTIEFVELTSIRVDSNDDFENGDTYIVLGAMATDSFGIYEFYRADDGGALVPVATDGFAASDATEYITGGGGAGYFLGALGTYTNFRLEGVSIPFSIVVIPGGATNIVIEGLSGTTRIQPRTIIYGDVGLDPANKSSLDYSHESHTFRSCRMSTGGGFGLPAATQALVEFDISYRSIAFGNTIDNVADTTRSAVPTVLYTFPSVTSLPGEKYPTNYGYQAGNKVDGIETSIERWQHDDATPPAHTVIDPTYAEYRIPWTKFRIDDHTVHITNFDEGYEGQEITVFVGSNANAKDIKHGAEIVLTGGVDITPAAGDLLRFQLVDPAGDGNLVWYQGG